MTNLIRTALEAEFDTQLPDNTSQSISASNLRSACTDMNDTIFRNNAIALEDKTGRILLEQGGYLLQEIFVPTYAPLSMTFDGVGEFYDKYAISASGNLVTFVCRFNHTGSYGALVDFVDGSNYPRVEVRIRGDTNKFTVRVFNSSGASICTLQGLTSISGDGLDHSVYFHFNGTAGTAILELDGVDDDDTGYGSRVAPTTGTLPNGVGTMDVHCAESNNGDWPWIGQISFWGISDTYRASSNFFESDGTPIEQDEVTWAGWGARPSYWNKNAQMSDNKGDLANMTVNGTPTGPA